MYCEFGGSQSVRHEAKLPFPALGARIVARIVFGEGVALPHKGEENTNVVHMAKPSVHEARGLISEGPLPYRLLDSCGSKGDVS